jgi:hypothetical protein
MRISRLTVGISDEVPRRAPMSSGLGRRLPTMKTKNLAELYDLAPLDWDVPRHLCQKGRPATPTALAGTRPGSPRSMPTEADT